MLVSEVEYIYITVLLKLLALLPIFLTVVTIIVSIKNRKLHIGLLICAIVSVGVAVVTIIISAIVGFGAIITLFIKLLQGWHYIG